MIRLPAQAHAGMPDQDIQSVFRKRHDACSQADSSRRAAAMSEEKKSHNTRVFCCVPGLAVTHLTCGNDFLFLPPTHGPYPGASSILPQDLGDNALHHPRQPKPPIHNDNAELRVLRRHRRRAQAQRRHPHRQEEEKEEAEAATIHRRRDSSSSLFFLRPSSERRRAIRPPARPRRRR